MKEKVFYEISAVADLTGLSSHVLRVWERRYDVVKPERSESKRRQYTAEDVERLKLLKLLVDSGHTIGSVAGLSTEQLGERVISVKEARSAEFELDENETGRLNRIGIVGTSIRHAIRDAADRSEQLRIIGEFESIEEMQISLQKGSIDLLFLERDTIFQEDVAWIQEAIDGMGAHRAIVIYRFAQTDFFEEKGESSIIALRGPVELAGIQLALGTLSKPLPIPETASYDFEAVGSGNVPDRVFSDEQLVRISKMSSVIDCECPQHLSSLLRSLFAFEQYSEQCENKNIQDAELHGYLHFTTAQCRHEMEKALFRVLSEEGISY